MVGTVTRHCGVSEFSEFFFLLFLRRIRLAISNQGIRDSGLYMGDPSAGPVPALDNMELEDFDVG